MPNPEEKRPKRLVRCMKELVITNDDALPTRISYPSILTPDELLDLRAVIDIWLRQLERQSKQADNLMEAIFGVEDSTDAKP